MRKYIQLIIWKIQYHKYVRYPKLLYRFDKIPNKILHMYVHMCTHICMCMHMCMCVHNLTN